MYASNKKQIVNTYISLVEHSFSDDEAFPTGASFSPDEASIPSTLLPFYYFPSTTTLLLLPFYYYPSTTTLRLLPFFW